MNRRKIFNIAAALVLLVSLLPVGVGAVPEQGPATATAPAVATNYTLRLPIPLVNIPPGAARENIPGYYRAALLTQMAQMEARLAALQEQGLIESYTPLPEANAFQITGGEAAAAQLQVLGELSEGSLSLTAKQAEAQRFTAQLNAAVTTAAPQAAPAAKAPPQVQRPQPAPREHLVSLAVSGDHASQAEARFELQHVLAILKEEGQVLEYEWLPNANAFRVRAYGSLETLSKRGEVSGITIFSESAVEQAAQGYRQALSATQAQQPALAPQAVTATMPYVYLYMHGYWSIYAVSDFTDWTVFTLRDSQGELKNEPANTYFDGWWGGPPFYGWAVLRDSNWNWVPIEPGDTLEVAQDGQTPFTIEVPDLTASIDRDADTVSGSAPPNITSTDPNIPPTLRLGASGINQAGKYREFISKYITTGSAGTYSTSLTYTDPAPGTLDLQAPNTDGSLVYTDAQGNQVDLSFSVPTMAVGVDRSNIWGRAESGTTVTVTLKTSAGVLRGDFTVETEPGGNFSSDLRDVYNNPVKAQPGDVVEMESALGTQISVDVVALTAFPDAAVDEVSGIAPPNIAITYTDFITLPALNVQVWGWGDQWVTTDAAGEYLADNVGNFNSGAEGETAFWNADGDRVFTYFAAPAVYIRGSRWGDYYRDNHVEGTSNPGLTQVDLKRGGTTLATAYTWNDGTWWSLVLYDAYGNPADIQAGDQVLVTSGGETITVDVPTLQANADYETEIVSGIAPADIITDTWGAPHSLYVYVSWPSWINLQVQTDASGAFSADFSSYGGIEPGTYGYLRYIDADGYYIYDDFYAPYPEPVVYVRGYYGGYNGENYVSGYVYGFCGYGTLTLKDSLGNIKARMTNVSACNSYGVSFYDAYGNPANILAGDSVEATFGEQTATVEVPEFEVLSDPDTDTVTGSTDAVVLSVSPWVTQTLAVFPQSRYDWDAGKHVLPVAGEFTAENPFYWEANPDYGEVTLDWWPGAEGHLRYIDANNNRVYTRFQAPVEVEYEAVTVYARGYYYSWWGDSGYVADNYIQVYNPGCGYVDVVLKAADDTIKAETTIYACNWGSTYLYDFQGMPVNIAAGDLVEATYMGETTVVEVPVFEVTSDYQSDTVIGSTDAVVLSVTPWVTQTLAVFPQSRYDWDYGKHVLPDAAGEFTAENPFYWEANPDYEEVTLDWWPGAEGHLRYIDGEQNRVFYRFSALYDEAQIWVHKETNSVWGYITQADAEVEVTLQNGAITKATAYAVSNNGGYFEVRLFDALGYPALIAEGDTVLVEGGADSVSVAVPQLSGQADVETELVSGVGPADSQLNVKAEWNSQGVLTAADGAYAADFRGVRDIQPGNYIEVQYRNPDGHFVYIDLHAGSKLYAMLNSSSVWGYAPMADIPITLTLSTGGVVKGQDIVTSWGNNEFDAWLLTPTGQRATIEAGDTLQADFGGGNLVSMVVTALSAEVDAEEDLLSGTGPNSTALGIEVGNFRQTVFTSAAGAWEADPGAAGEDISRGEQALVRHINAEFNETWLYAAAPVVYVRGDGPTPFDYWSKNCLSGHAEQDAFVGIELLRGATTIATRNVYAYNWNGYYSTCLYDALGLPADILGGDVVEVTSLAPQAVPVPEIQATVDAEANTVSGFGPPDADLGIYISYGGNQTVHTAADGAFTAAFSEIYSGYYAYIRYVNPDGNWIHSRFLATQTGEPQIRARWDGDTVCRYCASGQAGLANALLRLDLLRDGDVVSHAADFTSTSGDFYAEFTDDMGEYVDILPGDVIELSTGISMTVAELSAQVNKESGVLFGSAPANQPLYISWGYTIVTNPDGSYFEDIGAGSGNTGYIRYTDHAGHRTYLGWAVPYVAVQEHGNEVWGYVDRGVPVTVRLLNSLGAERGVATTTSDDWNGEFWIGFLNAAGDPLIIQPDDIVVVEASPATTVPVVPLSATVDLVAEQISGNAPAGAELEVYASTFLGGYTRDVLSDASGAFTADFSDQADIRGGDYFEVSHWNEEGNQVYLGYHAPMLRVNTANDIVDGYTTPNAGVSLVLKRGGSNLASAMATSDMGGFFSAFFTDASGALVDIKAGDVVEVSASPTDSITIANLTAVLDLDADTVTGTGPANSALYLRMAVWSGWGFAHYSQAVYTNASGSFTADFSEIADLTNTSYAYLRYIDEEGHLSTFNTTPAHSMYQTWVEQDVLGAGHIPILSGFGIANDGDLTPPMTFVATGGTSLLFRSRGGDLVITMPNGMVVDNGDTWFTLNNVQPGIYQVQLRLWDYEAQQYALAVGKAGFGVYLPVLQQAFTP